MENEQVQSCYIQAAKIISSCPKNRLKLVLSVLTQGGIDCSDLTISDAVETRMEEFETYEDFARHQREKRYNGRWMKTTNPVVLSLRNAYLDGHKISDIAKAAHITRTALYEFMHGRRTISPDMRKRFEHAFSALNIEYPPAEHTDPSTSTSTTPPQ